MSPDLNSDPLIRLTVTRLLSLRPNESTEGSINAACEFVYAAWKGEYAVRQALGEWDKTDRFFHPLRAISHGSAVEMARAVQDSLRNRGREFHWQLFEALLEARNERLARAGLAASTADDVASLMASIVGSGPALLDPACGLGGTLLRAAKDSPRMRVAGIDNDPEIAQLASMRLELAGLPGFDIEVKDWLEDEPVPEWDAVILDPPFGPTGGGRDNDMLWLMSACDSLAPNGRAAVLLPHASTSRSGRTAKERQSLLATGRVEAIIALPRRSRLDTAIPTVVWVLSGATDPRKQRQILLVNATRTTSEGGKNEHLDWSAAASVCNSWTQHAMYGKHDRSFAVLVPLDTLLAKGSADPTLYLERPAPILPDRPLAPGRLITELRLDMFKGVAAPTRIELKPLTLVFGKNSAGKSSMLQALLLLKQSVDARRFAPSGPLTDLGSFVSLIHRHDTERQLTIGMTFASMPEIDAQRTLPDPTRLRSVDVQFGISGLSGEAAPLQATVSLGDQHFHFFRPEGGLWSLEGGEIERFVDLTYSRHGQFPPRDSTSPRMGQDVAREVNARSIDVAFNSEELLPGVVDAGTLADVAYAGTARRQSPSETALRKSGDLVEAITEEVRNLLRQVIYLGPFREPPERMTRRSEKAGAIDVPFFLLNNTSEAKQVSSSLQGMKIPYELNVHALGNSDLGDVVGEVIGDVAVIVLTDTRSGVRVSPADVGFGVSQVLPIVVALSAATNSTILIEQPEIHLHPALQADLADLLIESVSESGRANQIIAETHSENLMLRVQRRIREGNLDPNTVTVIYVDHDVDGNALISELRIDSQGEFIDEWPDGFFVERFVELFGDGA